MFYNSGMEACIVVCSKNKPDERKGKVLFINGLEQVIEEKQMSFLSDENINTLFGLYNGYENVHRLSHVATLDEIRNKDYSLNVPLYVEKYDLGEIEKSTKELIQQWNKSYSDVKQDTTELFSTLKEVILND